MGDAEDSAIIDDRFISPNNLEFLTPRQVTDYMCKVQELVQGEHSSETP